MKKLLLGMHSSKLDNKNRLSIPAAFRAIIENAEAPAVFAYASLLHRCIEVCVQAKVDDMVQYIDKLDPFSNEKEAMATAILGSGEYSYPDSKGRIIIPNRMIKFASLDKEVMLIGKGDKFEIWDIEQFECYYAKARETAQSFIVSKRRD